MVFGGFDDWRLARINLTSPTTTAHKCSTGGAAACAASGNELGYMYYFNLDGVGDNTGTQTSGSVTLNNIRPNYWSATEFPDATEPISISAWNLLFNFGGQSTFGKSFGLSAWAVRPGDIAATTVPEPASLLLFGLAALGLVFTRRRGRRR